LVKKPLLEVGQTVWLETTSRLGCDVRFEDEPRKMVVLEANKTSAYIWFVGSDTPFKVRYKVDQRTHRVRYTMPDGRSHRIWMTKDDWLFNMLYEKEMADLKSQAHKLVDKMTLGQLRELVKQ
jgi:hypothetical protein